MSRPVTVAGICAALLVTAACSGSNRQHADGTPASKAPPSQTSKPALRGRPTAWRPPSAGARVAPPRSGRAVGKQCGEPNDYWDPNTNEIQLCYEDIQQSEQRFAASGNPDPTTAAVDATISGFYHELGHATLAIYQLAFTGREEDVADQLSAFMLLTPGADGKPYPNGVRIATDTAQDWKLSAKADGDANELPFWDGHPMDIQRMYNWECWIYGSDPAANANIVTSGDLPEDRAGNCEDEFQNMAKAWHQLLGPHLRKPG